MEKFNNGSPLAVCDICGKIIPGVKSQGFDLCSDCQKEPTVVDNFDAVEGIMEFTTPNTFYWVQVIKRRKDNPGMHGNNICYGSFCFYNYESLLRAKSELIKLSRTYNARVMFWINPRNIQELALPMMQLGLEYIKSKHYKSINRLFDHACGKYAQKGKNKLHIIDVDTRDPEVVNKICSCLTSAGERNPDFEIKKVLNTLHGFHILCNGFNPDLFKQLCVIEKVDPVDIHEDNPTVLYFNPQ